MDPQTNQTLRTRRSLLSRLKRWDDRESWQLFFDTYSSLIFGAAMQAGLTESEAEDVVQEVVIAVMKAIHSFTYQPERCAFKTWLHGITKRQVANQFRRRLGRGRVVSPLPGPEFDSDPLNDLPDPASHALDEHWEREWEANLLEVAEGRVKRRVRPAQFQIYDYLVRQQHSVDETMRHLGVSAPRVYLAKHRVLHLIRREVERLQSQYR